MSASLAEVRKHAAPQARIAFKTGLAFDLHAKSASWESEYFRGVFNQGLIAMRKVLALGWAKRMQLNPAGLGTRCG
jgi:hypothetical protein